MKRRMEIDDTERELSVDLRGYTIAEAERIADEKVREAWENGYSRITLIHACAYIRHHAQAAALGQGGIKWTLRRMLAQGHWNEYAYPRRSAKHEVNEYCMTLALRPNPNPLPVASWEPMPMGYYEWVRQEALATCYSNEDAQGHVRLQDKAWRVNHGLSP